MKNLKQINLARRFKNNYKTKKTKSKKQKAKSKMQKATSKKQKAKSKKRNAKSEKQQAKNNKQKAQTTQQTKSKKHKTKKNMSLTATLSIRRWRQHSNLHTAAVLCTTHTHNQLNQRSLYDTCLSYFTNDRKVARPREPCSM
jgi:hypothetical protein